MAQPASGEPLVEFLDDMRRLRAECGWKREQTHSSLARYLLEETHETLEVLDAWDEGTDASNDVAHLCEELGDLLLQVYFHAVIAEESGAFTIDDVARGIIAKMHRRNPHVFGDADQRAAGGNAAAINDAWQAIKAAEKPRDSVLDGIPPGLPALLLADKVLDRLDRLEREGAAPAPDPSPDPTSGADLGNRLLALVVEARETGVDPEQALRDAVRRLL